MKCWKIGEVTVTQIVERDLMGLLNKVIPDATLDAFRPLRWLFGVDPTLVSPAAKSITTEPIGRSCRDQTGHTGSRAPKSAQKMYETLNSRFPYHTPWRQDFPYIFCAVLGGASMAVVGMSENICFPTDQRPLAGSLNAN